MPKSLERLSRHLVADDGPSCANEDCGNHGRDCKIPGLYRAKGYTKAGSARQQCRLCGFTFSVGRSTLRQRKPHENRTIFSLLMNGVAMRRAAKVADVRPGTLYGKIDFLHRRCLRFIAAREIRLPEMRFERLYLSSDRQD